MKAGRHLLLQRACLYKDKKSAALCARSSTLSTAFARGSFADLLAAARPALLTAARRFIDSGPRAALGFLGPHAPVFVAFLNVFGLALLFAAVAGFVSSWHIPFQREKRASVCRTTRFST
jgi:hypothetical protein